MQAKKWYVLTLKGQNFFERFVTSLKDCCPVGDWCFKPEFSNPIMTPQFLTAMKHISRDTQYACHNLNAKKGKQYKIARKNLYL